MEISGENILFVLFGANLLVMILNVVFWVLVSLGDRKVKEREKQMYDKFNEVLDEANKQASKLVLDATEKANQMVKGSEVMVEDIRQEMRKSFAAAKDKNVALLESSLANMQKENAAFLNSLREGMVGDAKELIGDVAEKSKTEMQGLVTEMKNQSDLVRQGLEEKLNQEFEGMVAEINSYRQRKQEMIDKSAQRYLLRVFELVWPKVISLDEHEQLIFEALEEAKKEGVFGSGEAEVN